MYFNAFTAAVTDAVYDYRYNSVHKIHHEFKAPIGLVASYCHPFEMFLSNVLPLTGGMVLMQSHVFSGLTWAVFAVLGTQTCGRS